MAQLAPRRPHLKLFLHLLFWETQNDINIALYKHSYLVDALEPLEVWILKKGDDGFSTVKRASEYQSVQDLVAEGIPLGGLWYSDYLESE